MAELNELKSNLRSYVESITGTSKSGLYVCPLCGSGTGAKATGAFSINNNDVTTGKKTYKAGELWKCFSCGRSGDIFDLCAEYEHIPLSDATRRIMDLYGRPTRSSAAADFAPEPGKKPPEEKPMHDFSAEIERFAAALPGSKGETYLQGRGFTRATMQRFKLGYDAAHNSIVIPYNPEGTYYQQRDLNQHNGRNFYKLKGVTEPVFNAAALYGSDAVFVTESPLCAISIAQAGGAAVAIGGTGARKLVNQLKGKPTDAILIITLDNDPHEKDEHGDYKDEKTRKIADDLAAQLEAMGYFCVNGTPSLMGTQKDPAAADFRKDPNEVLQKSGADELKAAVEETAEAARETRDNLLQEQENERAQRTGAGMVDSFLQAVQTEKYKPMPTGITDIDRALYGGFTRGQIIMLGAAPGAGKTALAQWVFEGMAAQGTSSCIYLNLEMSREQILARSLSRIAKRQGYSINALQIMQGYKWTDEQRAAILAAAQEYKTRIAPKMIYNPDGISADLDTIAAYIEQEAQRVEKAGQPAPCVVLDYLQLLTGQPREDAAAIIKRAVMLFKGYAVKHNALVFMIIAHNRQANSSGAVSMEAARDTSAIEYSADLQLALTFTKCLKREGQKAKTPEELTKEEQHYITLRVVKGRFGGRGTDVDLYFNGETMTYTQIATDFTETNEPTPFTGKPLKTVAEI